MRGAPHDCSRDSHRGPIGASSRRRCSAEDRSGNGAAMRVAPVGAYFADDPDRAAHEAQHSAVITHAHPEGQAGAIAVAVAAATAASQPATAGRQFISGLLQFVPDGLRPAASADGPGHPTRRAVQRGSHAGFGRRGDRSRHRSLLHLGGIASPGRLRGGALDGRARPGRCRHHVCHRRRDCRAVGSCDPGGVDRAA